MMIKFVARILGLALLISAPLHGDVLVGSGVNNGGFVSQTSGFNGAPANWTAKRGVWIASGNSSLTTPPFGADTAANSRSVLIHHDAGETLSSGARFTIQAGETIDLSFDYKTSGSGAHTTLTVVLWDSAMDAVFLELGELSTAQEQQDFKQVNFSAQATSTQSNLHLRFVLSSGGGQGKDFLIDRVHLAGGVISPLEPIVYATEQTIYQDDTPERIIEKAAKTLPRPKQVEWQRMETTFFIHFGVNTFTGKEWGTGREDPTIFNPSALDAEQWVREIIQAGGKELIVVAKHHDGFCLWPSRYTQQDVASSSWLGGQGDVMRAVANACHAQGLKLGFYVSPADLFQLRSREIEGHPEGFYSNSSPTVTSVIPTDPDTFKSDPSVGRAPAVGFGSYEYQADDYNRYFMNQLYELLTEYGPVHQLWFDGANPEPGSNQTYDYPGWYDLILKLQPHVVIGIGGPDVRWAGTEQGYARETEWSVIPALPSGINVEGADLGSRAMLKVGSRLTWFPAEADVPVLNGWFWNASKTAKSAGKLIDIYYGSVGRNANLLLNISPDNRGLISANQVASLRGMGQVIRQTFATDLAQGAMVSASSAHLEHPANLATDGDLDRWWEPEAGHSTASLSLVLPEETTFDVISLQEAIATRGQRIEAFAIDTWDGEAWQQQATATTVGHKRLIRLGQPITTSQVRVRILECRTEPTLASVGLFRQAEFVQEPTIARNLTGQVTLQAAPGTTIRYSLDGSEPSWGSAEYTGPFDLAVGGTVKAVAFHANGSRSMPAIAVFGIAPAGWVATADSAQQASNPASAAIDGNPNSHWHTAYDGSGVSSPQPHWLQVDLGSARPIRGMTYLPRQDGGSNGTIKQYRCETSTDGTTWTLVAEGEFGNVRNNPIRQTVVFGAHVHARYVRLVSLEEVEGRTFASAAEIGVLAGGFDGWRETHGLQLESSAADSDEDGRSNWMEYAQGTDPSVADHVSTVIEWNGTEPAPSLRVDHPKNRIDVTISLQAVADLADPWQDVAADVERVGTADDGSQTLLFSEIDPPTGAARRFYRLAYRAAHE